MKRSIIYRWPALYKMLIYIILGKEYKQRFETVNSYIGDNSSVVELCCGFGDLDRYLQPKNVSYRGFDISDDFVNYGKKKGYNLSVADIANMDFPEADYYVMMSSLYHFSENAQGIIKKMLVSSRKSVIIVEPIKNMLHSNNYLIRKMALWFTKEGKNGHTRRFDEISLDNLMNKYFRDRISESKIIRNRNKIYVLDAGMRG